MGRAARGGAQPPFVSAAGGSIPSAARGTSAREWQAARGRLPSGSIGIRSPKRAVLRVERVGQRLQHGHHGPQGPVVDGHAFLRDEDAHRRRVRFDPLNGVLEIVERLDVLDGDHVAVLVEAAMQGALHVSMVMSHLASADEDPDQSEHQRARFAALADRFPAAERSLANSAACFLGEGFTLDLTRPGIALYGGRAGPQSDGHLKPVATLSAAVLQIREAKAGERAGYGGSARLERPTRIATVGLGYADGYLRALSGAGIPMRGLAPGPHALLAGHRVPILGRISMDLTLLDVTDLPEDAVQPGDRAEFFGPNVALDEVAAAAGTIGYELLTGLGSRVNRNWMELIWQKNA